MVEAADPLIGTLIGPYRIGRVIGIGGMGRVYLAEHPAIGSRVAVKVLSDQCAEKPDLLERFFAEARAVNLIRHESIVSVLDMARLPDGRPYIVMELVEGQTLGAIVRAGPAPIGGIVQVMLEVLSALDAAHAIQIVHRDLKPDNVLVTPEGHAKVLDFGIAKLGPGLQNTHSPRTATGALLGTPAYMAPEQISGAGTVDARTDVYAAGVVLFEALVGKPPFQGASLFDLMRAHLEIPPPSPRVFRAEVPASIEQVVLTALAKDPAHRFQTAGAMAHALSSASQELGEEHWRALSRNAAIFGGRPSAASIVRSSRRSRAASGSIPQKLTPTWAPAPIAAPPPPPRRRTGVIVLAAITGIAVVAVIVVAATRSRSSAAAPDAAVVATAIADGDAPVRDDDADAAPDEPIAGPATPPRSTVTTKQHGGITIQTVTPGKQINRPHDLDAKRFDAMKYAPKALALARQILADAAFVRLDIPNVGNDGLADLTLTDDAAEFYFRAPSMSKRPANAAPDAEIECYVEVDVFEDGVRAWTRANSSDEDCSATLRPFPRCSLAAVWARSRPGGLAKISFLTDGAWFVSTEQVSEAIADVCP